MTNLIKGYLCYGAGTFSVSALIGILDGPRAGMLLAAFLTASVFAGSAVRFFIAHADGPCVGCAKHQKEIEQLRAALIAAPIPRKGEP